MAKVKGGDKFVRKLEEIRSRVANPETLRVGFLENATYPDGKPVAMIAAIQNYGTGTIPPRPFFSNMIKDKQSGWGTALAANLMATNYDVAQSFARMGEGIAGQLRESIINTNSPPLAPSTLAKRGVPGMVHDPKNPKTFRAKPLVDTGHMLGSVDYDVK